MLKYFITPLKTRLVIISTALYITVSSCGKNNKNKDKATSLHESSIAAATPTIITPPTVPAEPNTNNLNTSINNSNSGTNSPSRASRKIISSKVSKSSSAPVLSSIPTPFAGLPNVGNTCYINAVLNVIAACYTNEIKGRYLEHLINKINTTSKPLHDNDIKEFINMLPEPVQHITNAHQQEDPDEFIDHIKEHFLYLGDDILHPVHYTESLYLKIKNTPKNEQPDKEEIYKVNQENIIDYVLRIPINCTLSDLSEMIKAHQEQCFKKAKYVDINWNELSVCPQDYLPSFVKIKQNDIDSVKQNSERKSKKDYIKQIIFQLPNILYLKVERNFNGVKINNPIHGAMHITIHPNPNYTTTNKFDLKAFIVHQGNSSKYGHYVSYVKRNGKWYKANDTIITELSEAQATKASQEAYLFFYTKK